MSRVDKIRPETRFRHPKTGLWKITSITCRVDPITNIWETYIAVVNLDNTNISDEMTLNKLAVILAECALA